jgi:hypothetical protein
MKWRAAKIGGRVYDLSHLHPFSFDFVVAVKEYAVYFKLSRAPSKGRLNLYVQSAYVQDDTPQTRPRPRKPIRFSVIAYNVAVGKVIKVPK